MPHVAGPGFWRNETSGVLAPVVMKYLEGHRLAPHEVPVMRAYLRQWIGAPVWRGPEIEMLRRMVDGMVTNEDIATWLDLAEDVGIDPL